MRKKKQAGRRRQVIYVATNRSIPGLVRIGRTSDIAKTMRTLGKGVFPDGFQCAYAARVGKVRTVERDLLELFEDCRLMSRPDYFRVPVDRVKVALRLAGAREIAAGEHGVPGAEDDDDFLAELLALDFSEEETKQGGRRVRAAT